MAADPRTKHYARLRRLRRSARRWSVIAGALVMATAVLLPYAGIGLADAFWAAAAGGTTALAFWRWSDFRVLAAAPAPPELDPAARASMTQRRIEAVVGRLPIGRSAITEMHRFTHLSRVRGSAVAASATRLDRATKAFAGLVPRLNGSAREVVAEAAIAESALRDLAERIASVERAMKTPAAATDHLRAAHADLLNRFNDGVTAYEALVSAAAAYVAEDGRFDDPLASGRLIEAGDLLRGIAEGMSDLRTMTPHAY
ncbi:MAG TPA: hypothetical protein VGJ28_17700 [Micromonosporaceae bacterium]|jgi:hypothetical protein